MELLARLGRGVRVKVPISKTGLSLALIPIPPNDEARFLTSPGRKQLPQLQFYERHVHKLLTPAHRRVSAAVKRQSPSLLPYDFRHSILLPFPRVFRCC